MNDVLRNDDIELYGHRMSEWQQVRPLAHWLVYFDPLTGIAYSHAKYIPEDVQRRLIQKVAFESHSQRAFIIVENNTLTEYKGLTTPYSDLIIAASGQPRGMLVKEHGEREKRALSDIASREVHTVKAEYHDVGVALLKRYGSRVEVRPLSANEGAEKEPDGERIRYGVLKRWGEDYIPFIRLDLFHNVRHLAVLEDSDHIELLSNALARLGRILRTAHELGIYHCFTHPGNVDAHGNLIDYEHAIYRDEIPALQEYILPPGDIELLTEEQLRFRDIDLFFSGARDVLKKCQECFNLNREGLMTQIQFVRENISLSHGIPVLELLAHLNIGFYEDTLKKLPMKDQRRIIEAFIDTYCTFGDRGKIREYTFAMLAKEREWTEEVSGFIANPENPEPQRLIPSELIFDLWNKPPLKP
jgi:hypothetical protein